MTAVFRHFLMVAGIFALGLTSFSQTASAQGMSFEKGRLTLITQSGRYDLRVDIAGNSSQAEYGLRYRPMLQPDEGLLIVQSRAAPTTISVNTDGVTLPLDLLFIASDGTIMEVHPSIPINSLTPIESNSPVGGALELTAGSIAHYGILPGDKIIGAGFGSG
jgi:uncharacterized membrane protein (UPF0127 family)